MSAILDRKKTGSSSLKLPKSQSLERNLKSGSGLRKTSSKTTLTNPIPIENQSVDNINYGDEVVLLFYDFLLKDIVKEWTPIVEESPKIKHEEEDVKLIDFKKLSAEDLVKSEVVVVKGSEVSLRKKRTLSNLSTPSPKLVSKEKSKSGQSLVKADANVSSKIRRKSSEKSDHSKRKRSSLESVSTATLTVSVKPEETVESSESKKWLLKTKDENAIIYFKNGNVYVGTIHRKAMHGIGKFWWADGSYYEGEFCNGKITGKGKMVLTDLSYYQGDFCEGFFHGNGVFCISSSGTLYSGGWKAGKKHGKGWLLYGPNNWYDGEWFEGTRHGFGIRRYLSGTVYEGMWANGVRNGEGSVSWNNNDFYKGEWRDGVPHGYGEYTWNAFFNKTLTFPILNTYQGSWANGMRNGIGLMHFGTEGGAKLAGVWKDNIKHGAGILVCGDGRQIQNDPLFLNDKPIHVDTRSSIFKNSLVPTVVPEEPIKSNKIKKKASLQLLSKQVVSKQPHKKFENVDFKKQKETKYECNPMDIPLHSVPEQVSFDYHIMEVLSTLKNNSDSTCESFILEATPTANKNISTSKWNIVTMTDSASYLAKNRENNNTEEIPFPIASMNLSKLHYSDISRYQTEEKHLRYCVTKNLQKLKQIYDRYATICSTQALDFKPVLVRLYLWQLWRDTGIVDDTTSIYDIDLILDENEFNGYETIHYPFEKIYFWQFLQALVSISWFLFMKNNEPLSCVGGILANCFRKFLEQYFTKNILHKRAFSLFEFKDMLPICAVYKLYCKLGEPHTARDFLKATCVKKRTEPPCYLKNKQQNKNLKISSKRAFNAVPVGLSIMYLPEETEIYQPIESIEYEDPFFDNLIAFRNLGIKTIVKCLAEVCPKICQDGMVVTIDYPLSFLEFYEVLLLCTYKMAEKIQKQKEKEQLEQELLKLKPLEQDLEGSDHVTNIPSDKKIRRNSIKAEKKKVKNK